MSMLRIDLEPVLHPPQNVTIEGIRNERFSEINKIKDDEERATAKPTQSQRLLAYNICPMQNANEYKLKEQKTYSMNTNQVLNCKWNNYVTNLPRQLSPVRFPSHEDFVFRRNKQQFQSDLFCQGIRRKLKDTQGVLDGKPTPVPTYSKKFIAFEKKDSENKNERGYNPNDYLKMHSKPFQGVKRKSNIRKCSL